MSENLETATFAGGCFWCTEAIFKRLKGVVKVTSGYAGGTVNNPTYNQVAFENTGHSESVQIEFDPQVVSFKTLLDVFWATHDPTSMDQQGADTGPMYRSIIFYMNETQKDEALNSKKHLEEIHEYGDKPIVTEIKPFVNFYTAEEYQQNFYESGQRPDYCTLVINPKIRKLLEKFNGEVREEYKS